MFRPNSVRFLRALSTALSCRKSSRSRPARLAVATMEDRVVPAGFNLSIDGDAPTANVSSNFDIGTTTTTFLANATGAVLDVGDIETALGIGNVVIDTNSAGSQAGNINWTEDSFSDELDYFGATLRSLTINTNGGNFKTTDVAIALSNNLDLQVSTVSGAINLANSGGYYGYYAGISGAHSVSLDAGATGNVNVNAYYDYYSAISTSGDITITGNALTTNRGASLNSGRDLIVNAKVDPNGKSLYLSASGDLSLNQAVIGTGYLSLSAGDDVIINAADGVELSLYAGDTATLNADLGVTNALSSISFNGGDVNFGSHAIKATDVDIYGANLGGTGTITVTGNASLHSGSLAPGGLGTPGTLTIVGDVKLAGGALAVDFAQPNSDKLQITGNLTLSGADLGGGLGTGIVTGSTQVVTYSGNLSGTFDNAPDDTAIVSVGANVVNVKYSVAGVISVTPPAPAANGTFTATEDDGTSYTAKLTGGGELVAGSDQFGNPLLFVRHSTTSSKLNVTTKANASDNLVAIALVSVDGPLGAFSGAQVNVDTFSVVGAAKSITIHDLNGPMTLGGTQLDKTTLTAKNIGGTVTATDTLSKVTVAGNINSDVTAAAIGALKAKNVGLVTIKATLGGIDSITTADAFFADVSAASVKTVKVGTFLEFGTWTVKNGATDGRVGSITADAIYNFSLKARSLGTLSATGSRDGEIVGDIQSSFFTLSGDDGSPRKYGLKTVKAKGSVVNSAFDIQAGNVDSVTVGRFISSQLYLNYTPNGAFNTGTGTFNSAAVFKLNKFSTTASTIGDPNSSFNYSFSDSQIVADTIGTIKLSGIRTKDFATAFGIKFRTSATSIKVASADDTVALNTNLIASVTAIKNDFFILDVL